MPGSKNINKEILTSAQIIWDYLQLNQPLEKGDVLVAMGSHDLRVAEYAAELVLEGWAPLLVCSGGFGRLTKGIWQQSEAILFADKAESMGLSRDRIILEERSTNTGENLMFTRSLLTDRSMPVHSVILVHKPYMERRVWAAVRKVWPEVAAVVSSPPIAFHAYPTGDIPIDKIINIMVGDFQRVLLYPGKGYAIEQPVHANVMRAFNNLMQNGFTTHLLAD